MVHLLINKTFSRKTGGEKNAEYALGQKTVVCGIDRAEFQMTQ